MIVINDTLLRFVITVEFCNQQQSSLWHEDRHVWLTGLYIRLRSII